ncbi:hypothetical protein GCM10027275_29650 [Rhabdobacter roseus]|uniref:Peptidyl-prolyl cis-trans isomerase n=1 Tax=Rhabdobacter roseus TaxID=1655419 RepID=A0A840TYF8_9BACT|nr:FKBP-type peptidyl-prolyl cis-trans isomerase [Rhabdobacter roseus]MBB5284920.1 FKBP-type peptidyl-prolyl cis-trans isomerase [Rhabdobacter roseus]
MIQKWTVAVVMLSVIALASCNNFLDKENKQIEENERKISEYLTANNLSATLDSSGLYYVRKVSNASGRKANIGDEVSIYYRTYTLDGRLIDSTETSKGKPFIYPALTLFHLRGVILGVNLMRTGEKFTLLLPYYLAYGNDTYGSVPAYSPLRVEVELVNVRTEGEQIQNYLDEKEYEISERLTDNLNIVRRVTTTGDTIGKGKVVKLNYTGRTLDGKEFDKGNYTFTTGLVGQGAPIPGFDRGVRRLRNGETAVLVFPSALGYGRDGARNQQTGQFVINPYAPLAFEVEIISVTNP